MKSRRKGLLAARRIRSRIIRSRLRAQANSVARITKANGDVSIWSMYPPTIGAPTSSSSDAPQLDADTDSQEDHLTGLKFSQLDER